MSEFWKRKARKYFSVFDLDADGIIDKKDFIGMAIRFAQIENADKQKAEKLKTEFEKIWEMFVSETGNMNKLTVPVFVDSILKQRDNPELWIHFTEPIRSLFHLMDVNCDGYLQPDEYFRMLAQLGVPDASFTKAGFEAMDVNGDGKLSIDQFVNAFIDFMSSEDEKNPNTFFFGPLNN